MKYYEMVGEGPYPVKPIEEQPILPGGPWYAGKPVGYEVPDPMEYILEADEEDYEAEGLNLKTLYCSKAYPVIHDSLVEALKAAGVDNLELFHAHLKEPDTGIATIT